MQDAPRYDDVVREVMVYLRERRASAIDCGVRHDAIIVDPGIGFGKTFDHNRALMAATDLFAHSLDASVLIGASRKGFLGTILGGAPVESRDDATLAATVYAFMRGASIVRVHNVAASVAAAKVLDSFTSMQQGALT